MADSTLSLPSRDRPTAVRHLVLTALLLVTTINYVQRNALAITATTTAEDLGIGDDRMGLVLGAFFLSYTFMQVPAGGLAQRFGAKWTLVAITACWSLATAALGLSRGFDGLYFWRLVQGVFQAGIFACATLILAVWYPQTRRGLASALLNSFMILGSVVGAFLTGWLLEYLGWRAIMALYALPGLVWAAWFAWWFHSRPQDHPSVNPAELRIIRGEEADSAAIPPASRQPDLPSQNVRPAGDPLQTGRDQLTPKPADLLTPTPAPVLRSIHRTVPILAVTLLCTQQVCRAGANRLFDNVLPTYLEKERHTGKALAAQLTGWIQIAMVVGGLLGGMLSDEVLRRTGRLRLARNGVALASLAGCVLLYLLAYPIENVFAAAVVAGLGAAVFCFSSPCAYALAMDMGGKNLAVVFALMNMAGNLGAWAFVSFVPALVPVGGWDLALSVFLAMHLAAAVCWAFLNPNADLTLPPAATGAADEE